MFWHIDCVPLLTLHHLRGVFFSTFCVMLLEGPMVSARPSLVVGLAFLKTKCVWFFCVRMFGLSFFCLFVSYWTFSCTPYDGTCLSIFRTLSALRTGLLSPLLCSSCWTKLGVVRKKNGGDSSAWRQLQGVGRIRAWCGALWWEVLVFPKCSVYLMRRSGQVRWLVLNVPQSMGWDLSGRETEGTTQGLENLPKARTSGASFINQVGKKSINFVFKEQNLVDSSLITLNRNIKVVIS